MIKKYPKYSFGLKIYKRVARRVLLSLAVGTVLFSIIGCSSQILYRPNNKQYLSVQEISPNKPIMIPSYSGNLLNALFIPAQGDSNGVLLVHFHGNAGNITWTSQRYSWLAESGYDLFVFDYSGYGESTGTPSPDVISKDVETILDYSVSLKETGEWKKLILAGTSMGGYVLLDGLATYEKKNEFDIIFIDSSFLSYHDVVSYLLKDKPGSALAEAVSTWLISDAYAPARHLPFKLTQPLIVSHCSDDSLVDIELGKNVFSKIDAENKQWVELDGCAHAQGYREKYPEHRQRLIEALAD